MKIYCEDCKFSWMEMVSDENVSPVDGGKWHQAWNCRNSIFTTKTNAVNKPFIGEVSCLDFNKNNNCKGYTEKTFLQKHGSGLGIAVLIVFIAIGLIITLLNI